MLPLTVLIHTRNESEQISACLSTVSWAQEIYLLDDESSDDTVAIVSRDFPKVRIERHRASGSAAQKNYGADRAANDWILVIDADERVTPSLRDEIRTLLATTPALPAYSIGRQNYVLNQRVRFSGLQRDRVVRLFHRGHARYPNRRVHADLVADGLIGQLREPLQHYYVRSLSHMVEKMTRYGYWAAAQSFRDGKQVSLTDIALRPISRFVRDYIINLGFLDGARGVVVVGLHTFYVFWKYAKLWEFQQLERMGEIPPLPEFDDDPSLWRKPWERSDEEPLPKASSSRTPEPRERT